MKSQTVVASIVTDNTSTVYPCYTLIVHLTSFMFTTIDYTTLTVLQVIENDITYIDNRQQIIFQPSG